MTVREFFESFFPKNIFNDTIKVHTSEGGRQYIDPNDLDVVKKYSISQKEIEEAIDKAMSVYREH